MRQHAAAGISGEDHAARIPTTAGLRLMVSVSGPLPREYRERHGTVAALSGAPEISYLSISATPRIRRCPRPVREISAAPRVLPRFQIRGPEGADDY